MSEKSLAQQSEVDSIRQTLTPLFELPDDTFSAASDEFTQDRLAELLKRPKPERGFAAEQGRFQGFIPPDLRIYPQQGGNGFLIDDPTLYNGVLPYMRYFYRDFQSRLPEEDAYRNAALSTAQHVQQAYFQTVHNGQGAAEKREAMLGGDFMGEEPVTLSIADFKNIAACAERAAVANNVLQILGTHPVMEMGMVQVRDDPPVLHAYLFIRGAGGNEVLYDPTNPKLEFDTNGQLVGTRVATYPVEDVVTKRDSSMPIIGTRPTFEVDPNGLRRVTENTPMQYWLSPLGPELHPN